MLSQHDDENGERQHGLTAKAIDSMAGAGLLGTILVWLAERREPVQFLQSVASIKGNPCAFRALIETSDHARRMIVACLDKKTILTEITKLQGLETMEPRQSYVATNLYLLTLSQPMRACFSCLKDYDEVEGFYLNDCREHTVHTSCLGSAKICPCNSNKDLECSERLDVSTDDRRSIVTNVGRSNTTQARSQEIRCLRCVKTVELMSTDDPITFGMVRVGHNLYYCDKCAKYTGFIPQTGELESGGGGSHTSEAD